jgi:hypothetical protein
METCMILPWLRWRREEGKFKAVCDGCQQIYCHAKWCYSSPIVQRIKMARMYRKNENFEHRTWACSVWGVHSEVAFSKCSWAIISWWSWVPVLRSKKLTGNRPGKVCLRSATTRTGTLCYQRGSCWSAVSAQACRTETPTQIQPGSRVCKHEESPEQEEGTNKRTTKKHNSMNLMKIRMNNGMKYIFIIYICIYTYIYVYMCVYIYIYVYIQCVVCIL